jgi:hypothetical protein
MLAAVAAIAVSSGAWAVNKSGRPTNAPAKTVTVKYGIVVSKEFDFGAKGSCNNATFGDPARGVNKECYSGLGEKIASEGKGFTRPDCCTAVLYGKLTSKSVPMGSACNNATFGDPAKGYKKACYIDGRKVADEGGEI